MEVTWMEAMDWLHSNNPAQAKVANGSAMRTFTINQYF